MCGSRQGTVLLAYKNSGGVWAQGWRRFDVWSANTTKRGVYTKCLTALAGATPGSQDINTDRCSCSVQPAGIAKHTTQQQE